MLRAKTSRLGPEGEPTTDAARLIDFCELVVPKLSGAVLFTIRNVRR